jgi:hypothetical protein
MIDRDPSIVPPGFFDEHSRPDFRAVYGKLLARSTQLEVALTSIRLSTLDLGQRELHGVTAIRLLLAEVSAVRLDAEAHAVMQRAEKRETLATLTSLLSLGVIEVRSSPLGGWSPDFSIFFEDDQPHAVVLGFHWFERPFPHRGPAFASVHGPDDARRAHARFDELWSRAHDIGPAVLGILERARSPETIGTQGVGTT